MGPQTWHVQLQSRSSSSSPTDEKSDKTEAAKSKRQGGNQTISLVLDLKTSLQIVTTGAFMQPGEPDCLGFFWLFEWDRNAEVLCLVFDRQDSALANHGIGERRAAGESCTAFVQWYEGSLDTC